jgi:hypothetical protein
MDGIMNYSWRVVYSNHILDQYPKGQPENTSAAFGVKSGEFWLDHDLPESFYVGEKYGVDLRTGAVLFDGKGIQVSDKNGRPLTPVALIYYRQCHASINTGGEIAPVEVIHVVGYRASTGSVVKLMIPENGIPSISFGD